MNMKAIAVIVSAIMAFSAAAVVLTDNADAVDSIDKGIVNVAEGGTAEVTFVVTEPDNTYFDNTVTWSDGTYQIYPTNQSKTDGNSKVSYSMDDTKGTNGVSTYTLTIKGLDGKGSAGGTEQTLSLKYTITTKVKNQDSSNSITQILDYTVTAKVYSSPLVTNDNGFQFTVGAKDIRQTVSTELDEKQYKYYATGLPKGLQMTPDGFITGTPAEATSEAVDVTVIATNPKTGVSFQKTYQITATAAALTGAFTYDFNGTAYEVGTNRYMAYQEASVKLTTNVTDVGVQNIGSVTVYDSVNGDVIGKAIAGSSGVYTLPTTGTGEYRIVMVNGDYTKEITLVVVAVAGDVSAGIGFSPATPAISIAQP